MKCPNCGKQNREGVNFCGFCGVPLIDNSNRNSQEQVENTRFTDIYNGAVKATNSAGIESEYKDADEHGDINSLEPERKTKPERVKARRLKIIIAIVTSITIACVAFVYLLMNVIIPTHKYNQAISLIDAGEYVEAYEALIDLNGYKDSGEKINEIYDKYKLALLKKAQVGDYVVFGSYEQDNNTSNGKEEIQWLVLAREGDNALLISMYALDCQQYHTSRTKVTWETCSLRKWMNDSFISNAFSSDEQALILSTTVKAGTNPAYSTSPGNDTTDKVFCLSVEEANTYFDTNDARRCQATFYAQSQGAYANPNNNTCWWWLRSPVLTATSATRVGFDGSIDCNASYAINRYIAVRPALWINLGFGTDSN